MARCGVLAVLLALCLALASASDAGRALLADSSIIPTAGAAPLANGNGDVLPTGARARRLFVLPLACLVCPLFCRVPRPAAPRPPLPRCR
jgi:hypothetical protein